MHLEKVCFVHLWSVLWPYAFGSEYNDDSIVSPGSKLVAVRYPAPPKKLRKRRRPGRLAGVPSSQLEKFSDSDTALPMEDVSVAPERRLVEARFEW